MSITVEHDKRKREILEKALDVFVAEGYEDTTFQKIAERCGITRTILYLYFRNKREVFAFSLKLFLERLEAEILAIGGDTSLSQAEKLVSIVAKTIGQSGQNARLLSVILDYLGHYRASGGNADERVRRRTIRLRHILAGIMVEGQRSGEFRRFPVKAATDLLYGLIEAAIFRIAVLGRDDKPGLVEAVRLFAEGLGPRTAAEAAGGTAPQAASRGAGAVPAATDTPAAAVATAAVATAAVATAKSIPVPTGRGGTSSRKPAARMTANAGAGADRRTGARPSARETARDNARENTQRGAPPAAASRRKGTR